MRVNTQEWKRPVKKIDTKKKLNRQSSTNLLRLVPVESGFHLIGKVMENLLGYEVNTFDSEYPKGTISTYQESTLENLVGYEVNTFDSGYPS